LNGYLLDTHVWIWYLQGTPRLPSSLRRLIDKPGSVCWLSPISIWEVSRLITKGKMKVAPFTFDEWLPRALGERDMEDASFTREVARAAAQVRLGHGDPIDHLLVGTALAYDLVLLTLDRELARTKVVRTRSN